MSIDLNHTIVHASDRDATADFLTDVLGLPEARTYGPFRVVELSNGVSLDVMTAPGPITPQHYAFLVGDAEFDAIHDRIVARGLPFWADPFRREPGRVNHHDGGRGLYWPAPDDHNLEIITVPYGG
ncbi:VOC family protein [Pimelobacter simplex]|uniref:Glyoxalase/Bleomycin resistance protein/dioxygenase domain n=1 Tax=Nocardioides simplex TaxID=2045 RepID=A0A0A1DHV5_NOCSI|nr:VOC family protein [Pimelobacter simplex]AIY16946.1 Glyoxalase/Bleomycin resistance protein/dioxygenase domain [Pimelobacter simplex]MCG8152095.1 VOC family protein [Pimelobacter simplex]GEB12847.1 cysteine transferase [Pimelobacter simplex]SFM53355.1 Glyoxalase/Bleomycin resistance protein/Dioxygenase superfamily protein [Pimelobacter simplex]